MNYKNEDTFRKHYTLCPYVFWTLNTILYMYRHNGKLSFRGVEIKQYASARQFFPGNLAFDTCKL